MKLLLFDNGGGCSTLSSPLASSFIPFCEALFDFDKAGIGKIR